MSQEILNVEGMSCGHCKSAVESALNNIDGVTSADVNLENGQVSVQYDDSKVAVSQMKDAIEDQVQRHQHQIKKIELMRIPTIQIISSVRFLIYS